MGPPPAHTETSLGMARGGISRKDRVGKNWWRRWLHLEATTISSYYVEDEYKARFRRIQRVWIYLQNGNCQGGKRRLWIRTTRWGGRWWQRWGCGWGGVWVWAAWHLRMNRPLVSLLLLCTGSRMLNANHGGEKKWQVHQAGTQIAASAHHRDVRLVYVWQRGLIDVARRCNLQLTMGVCAIPFAGWLHNPIWLQCNLPFHPFIFCADNSYHLFHEPILVM